MKDLQFKPTKGYTQWEFWNDWDSLIFWQKMNWRDFTFVALSMEISPILNYEFYFAILGLHIRFNWWKKTD